MGDCLGFYLPSLAVVTRENRDGRERGEEVEARD